MMLLRTLAAVACLTLATPLPSMAATKAQCQALGNTSREKLYEVDFEIVKQCAQQGWDPPENWRVNDGKTNRVRAGAAGGFSISSRNPPDSPPGIGGTASVSSSAFNFSLSFPPWRGFPCQLPGGSDLCSGDSDGAGGTTGGYTNAGGSASCAAAGDTTGTFGTQTPIAAGSSSVTCGASIGLTTYSMTITSNPSGVVATEAGSSAVWLYARSGTGFGLTQQTTLPSYFCDSKGIPLGTTIPPAAAQIITYNASSSSVAIRLQNETPSDVYDPFNPESEVVPDRYFVVPIVGGVPQIPQTCARVNESNYIKTITSMTAPLVIQPSMAAGCEGTADQCAGQSTTPTTTAVCDAVTLQPSTDTCTGKVQFVSLDRPALVYPAGSTITTYSMQGRTGMIAQSAAAGRIYAQSGTLAYFGAQAGSFILPDGGKIMLDNGTQLIMNAPATITPGSRSVALTAGGTITTLGGETVSTLSPGSSYNPGATLPWAVSIGRSIELPAGLGVPTMPSPTARLPMDSQ